MLKTYFDEASMLRKLKKLGKVYGDGQDQAIKRWGVQACRDLAKYTQIFGSQPKAHKLTLLKDAGNVIYTHEGGTKRSKTGRSLSFKIQGKDRSINSNRYLTSESDVLDWIEQNRTAKYKRTRKLPTNQKKACSNAMLKRAINQKYKLTSGMAKDGWLDAGEDIARGQKGRNPAKIGVGLMKFARKPRKYGYSATGGRNMKAYGELINKVEYVSYKRTLSSKHKKQAIRDSMRKTLKWYKYVIRAENKKKK